MRVNPTFFLPLGYEGIMLYPNTHDVPKGTKFIIVAVYENDISPFHYRVNFKGKKFKEINSEGPFIEHREVDLGENSELFFARTKNI